MALEREFERILACFDTAMLVTHAPDGKVRSRPLAILARETNGCLLFASRSEDAKLAEIERDTRVAVTCQGGGRYLSISGQATTFRDPELAAKLWTTSMKPWFPEGPGDPDLALIRVQPEVAEYWDRSGLLQLQFLWEAGKALATGRLLDEARLAGHGTIRWDDDRDETR